MCVSVCCVPTSVMCVLRIGTIPATVLNVSTRDSFTCSMYMYMHNVCGREGSWERSHTWWNVWINTLYLFQSEGIIIVLGLCCSELENNQRYLIPSNVHPIHASSSLPCTAQHCPIPVLQAHVQLGQIPSVCTSFLKEWAGVSNDWDVFTMVWLYQWALLARISDSTDFDT